MIAGRTIAVLCAGLLAASSLPAQTVIVRGTVRDANTHRAIPDVSVSIPSGGVGGTTDAGGGFVLRIPDADAVPAVVFRHVSYDSTVITIAALRADGAVFLRPRIIPLTGAEITGTRRDGAAGRELPVMTATLEARDFDLRGYTNAGDLLRGDHSVQVDEEFTGRTLVSLRGGNADEVIVLSDGLRLNSGYTNEFDLALIELADVERIEILKGSNTSLYGSDAFSGVINIVPKQDRDYTLRLHQQIGSYDSGIWGVQFFRRVGRIAGSYSLRSGGMARAFADAPAALLTNSRIHHSGSVAWRMPGVPDSSRSLALTWRVADLAYVNERDNEQMDEGNSFAGLRYDGAVPLLGDLVLAAGYNGLRQSLAFHSAAAAVDRGIDENAVQTRIEKRFSPAGIDVLLSYQFAHASLDVDDHRNDPRVASAGVEATALERMQHGFVAVTKITGETGSTFFRGFDFDVSLRQDVLHDTQDDVTLHGTTATTDVFRERDWSHTLFKFAVSLQGVQDDFLLDVFLGYGNNVRVPTLFQQVQSPALFDSTRAAATLAPETNRSVEIGVALTRTIDAGAVSGWDLTAGLFQNSYENKFRAITTPGIPLTLYDHVDDARISGLEGTAGLFFWGSKVRVEFGISRYFISDRAAFPFRAEHKRTLGLRVHHAGWSVHLFHCTEGEQIGLLRRTDGGVAEVVLPASRTLDLHAGTFLNIGQLRLFLNISLRNILGDDDLVLSGLALRDRRYHLTMGIQY
ncbi:MAG: TonB-dependent receptor plug domain-containing protein [Bacteroidota bacterium]|jgi:outer membrane receptor protein involved in Fe transport|nr:TonB-dependent receptor plug domain-containing protein [Bacteroidota bacterium]